MRLEKLLVVLDPGHGAPDPGAIGPTGLKESEVVLSTARLLAKELQQRGFPSPILTRADTYWPGHGVSKAFSVEKDLRRRCEIANRAKADLFVSLHCNAAGSSTAHGIETWIYSTASQASADLAQRIQTHLVAAQGLADRGVKRGNLYVLRHTVMPAVLVELAFISHPAEERLLRDQSWLAGAARAIADGIEAHIGGVKA